MLVIKDLDTIRLRLEPNNRFFKSLKNWLWTPSWTPRTRAFFDANTRFNMKKSFDHFDWQFRTWTNVDKANKKRGQAWLFCFDHAWLRNVHGFEQKIVDEQV